MLPFLSKLNDHDDESIIHADLSRLSRSSQQKLVQSNRYWPLDRFRGLVVNLIRLSDGSDAYHIDPLPLFTTPQNECTASCGSSATADK